jgi:hypothetical protein
MTLGLGAVQDQVRVRKRCDDSKLQGRRRRQPEEPGVDDIKLF